MVDLLEAIADVVVTLAFEVPLVTVDSIGVVDAMEVDTEMVDIQYYYHRYYLTEALPSVPMLVVSIPIRLILWTLAELAYQTVDLV